MKLLAGLLALIGSAASGAAASQAAALRASQASQAPSNVAASKATTPPAAADQHQHGIARLRIVVEGDLMSLRLRVPLESLTGFEAAPRTAKQRHAVKDMAARLREAQWLFASPNAAACALQEIRLASDVVSPALLADGADKAAEPAIAEQAKPAANGAGARNLAARTAGKGKRSENQGVPAHADLEAAIWFKCANPQALTGLQVRLFDAFPRLRQIDAEILTPRGQSGARLSPNRTGLTW